MNRRTALKFSVLSGAVLPATAFCQDPESRTRSGRSSRLDDQSSRSNNTSGSRRQSTADDLAFPEDVDPTQGPAGGDIDAPPANFREEAGHAWRSYDIARYTSQARTAENPKPQNALVEWIFRTTGSATWHGEKIAVLSAGIAQLRAYHNPRVLAMVEETVTRFTRSTADVLSVRVKLIAAQDTRWRYSIFNRLKRVSTGPQGQQAWMLDPSDAQSIHNQLMLFRGYMLLADQTVRMINGQTLTIDHSDKVNYIAATQTDGASELGPQPRVEPLSEGVVLRLSPLLNYEGDALDAAIDLRATTIKRLVRTKILARRSVGPIDMSIDVPEVLETRFNQALPNWPLGQVLVISAGIVPGILQRKAGFMNLPVPGTYPTDTELLAMIEIEAVRDAPRAARRRSRPSDDQNADEPAFRSARSSGSRSTRRDASDEDL